MSTSTEANSTTLNIPQLALLLLVGFLAVRWILSSNNSPSTSSAQQRGGAASRGAGPRINPRHVDTIAAMFPQLSRREIMWDLQRNGGNVQMTTERVLSGQGLETVCYILFQSIAFFDVCSDGFNCSLHQVSNLSFQRHLLLLRLVQPLKFDE
jgi:CUE domain